MDFEGVPFSFYFSFHLLFMINGLCFLFFFLLD